MAFERKGFLGRRHIFAWQKQLGILPFAFICPVKKLQPFINCDVFYIYLFSPYILFAVIALLDLTSCLFQILKIFPDMLEHTYF